MDTARSASEGIVHVRIRNASTEDFDQVVVEFPDQQIVDYGAVPKGQATDYRPASRAYRYAGITIQAGANTWSFHPIDYMGETPLAPGRYTYVLDVENGQVLPQLLTEA